MNLKVSEEGLAKREPRHVLSPAATFPAAVGSRGQASPKATPMSFQSHEPIHHLIVKSDCVSVLQMYSA